MLHLFLFQQLALSAGYFTKCPGCNNNSEFLTCIKYWGVFVPERDASWEAGENAFSELYEVHDTCDVKTCVCPEGRDYSTIKGKWRLVLCYLCGSYGTHQGCSQFKNKFVCDVCNIEKSSSGNNTTSLLNGESAVTINGDKETIENRRYNTRFVSTRRSCVENLGRNNCDDKVINIQEERYSCDDKLLHNEKDPLDLDDEVIVIDSDDDDSIKPSSTSQNDPLKTTMTKVENVLNDEASTSMTPKTLLPNRSERNVALKSTTKLPYTYEDSLLQNVIKSEHRNSIILKESDKPKDSNSIIVEDSKDEDTFNVQDQISTCESRKNKDDQHDIDQRVAETELVLIKECENNFSENTSQLEKNTINSLDDIIDLDLYPDKETNSNNSNNLEKDPNLINSLSLHFTSSSIENQSSSSNSKHKSGNNLNERRVATKSTTKLPCLKRKAGDSLEEVSSKRPYFESHESQFSPNSIVCNANDEVDKVKKFKPILRRSPVRRSEDINALINTVIFGDQYRQNTTSLPLNCSADSDIKSSKDEKQPLESSDSKENSLHYKVLLDVEREVEFVHSPKCSVSTEVRKYFFNIENHDSIKKKIKVENMEYFQSYFM